MKVLLVDKSKSRLQKLFPAQEFFSYEKIDDFTYNKIDEATANSLANSTFYYGHFVNAKSLKDEEHAFIVWIPGKGRFFEDSISIRFDEDRPMHSDGSFPFVLKLPGLPKEPIPPDAIYIATFRGTKIVFITQITKCVLLDKFEALCYEECNVLSETEAFNRDKAIVEYSIVADDVDWGGTGAQSSTDSGEDSALSSASSDKDSDSDHTVKENMPIPQPENVITSVIQLAQNDELPVIRSQPKFKSIKNLTDNLRSFSLEGSTYRLVFINDPAKSEFYAKCLEKESFADLAFQEFKLDGDEETYFLSKPLSSSDVIELIRNNHPCTRLYEICLLNTEAVNFLDHELFWKALNQPFLHADRIFRPFHEFVQKVASADEKLLLARLFHIAQSSGTGKTRVCLELISKLNRGIYCVFRQPNSTGFPRTTEWLGRLINLFKECTSEDSAVNLCIAFIYAAIETFGSYSTPVSDFYTSSTTIRSTKFKAKFEKARSLTAAELLAKFHVLAGIGGCFPVILDECHELLCYAEDKSKVNITLYRAFRRAMIYLKKFNIVAICLGTKSSLNDFVLNYHVDASARPTDTIKPISPYIFVHTFDVFVDENAEKECFLPFEKYFADGKIVPDALKKFAVSCGRPLWNAYEGYDFALRNAITKLTSDCEIAMLSAFVLRTGAPVVPSCSLAHKLVLSGMATLEYVDVLGESCFMSYSPEPVAANAARLLCGSLANLGTVLNQFLDYVNLRFVLDTGSAGEFVARVILLRVVDCLTVGGTYQIESDNSHSTTEAWISSLSASNKNSVPLPVTTAKFPNYCVVRLKHFLCKLANISEESLKDLDLSDEMLDGLVNVSQFIATKRPFNCTQGFLKHGFLRAIGFSLPLNHPGADLMIPVYRTDGLFSPILIQVKNLDQLSIPGEDTDTAAKILDKLTAKYTGMEECLEQVPGKEFAKVVIQFSEARSKEKADLDSLVKIYQNSSLKEKAKERRKRAKTQNIAIEEDEGEVQEKGKVLWILGLDGFDHLFEPTGFDIIPAVAVSSSAGTSVGIKFNNQIMDNLNSILNNARDFVDSIKEGVTFETTESQCKRAGIKKLLQTHLPMRTTDYFGLPQDVRLKSKRKLVAPGPLKFKKTNTGN